MCNALETLICKIENQAKLKENTRKQIYTHTTIIQSKNNTKKTRTNKRKKKCGGGIYYCSQHFHVNKQLNRHCTLQIFESLSKLQMK